jgi:uncharacterized protein YjdB
MKQVFYFLSFISFLMTGCIGDDIISDQVPEEVRIINPIDSLKIGDSYPFEASFFNNIGEEENRFILWSSSDTSILMVDQDGVAIGLALGEATLTATVDLEGSNSVSDQIPIIVNEDSTIVSITERTGMLQTTSSYTLQGSFVLKKEGDDLVLYLSDNYAASSSLPGLYLYLTNNANSVNGALEIGAVSVFNGAHSYEMPAGTELNDYNYLLYYCKPFSVKVGHGEFEN